MQGRIALEELNRELDAAKSSIEAWAEAKTTSAVELRRKHAKLLEEHKGTYFSNCILSSDCVKCRAFLTRNVVLSQVTFQSYGPDSRAWHVRPSKSSRVSARSLQVVLLHDCNRQRLNTGDAVAELATELSEETALEAEVRNLEVEGSEAGGQLQALQGIVSGKSADLTTREAGALDATGTHTGEHSKLIS